MNDEVISHLDFSQAPPRREKYDWESIARQLREHPGQWALVFEHGKTSTANAIRQGAVKALDPGLGFQVRTTNNQRSPQRTCTLWLRWNPPSS